MGQHFAAVASQDAQQLIFDGRQMQLLFREESAACRIVDPKRAVDKYGRFLAVALHLVQPPDRNAKPGQQFIHGKGLDQIIVRSGVQRFDLVAVIAAGADDNNGQIGPGTDFSDHLHAIQIGQAQIQQHNVRVMRGSFHDSRSAVGSGKKTVIMGFQGNGNQIADGWIILHNQNQRLIHSGSPPLWEKSVQKQRHGACCRGR